ncbi:MAG TPA: DUF3488 and transglutaminase-like domain-containing protein [Planctomicrobium sp.]|nr:DUF3488 and transglutaminase-like domain-containing protein [Planctomicrobium sp.]
MGPQRRDSMLLIFQISTLIQVSLTSLILAAAEEFPLPLATIPIALISWWIVDWKGIQLVPVWMAPILALGAFGLAIFEYNYDTQQSMLAVCGHLLVYLVWVFLLQQKEGRQYWWLFALCLLQVAVSAMLTYSIWFGFGLLLYALVAIWTLSVFLLYSSTLSLNRNVANVEIGPDPSRDPASASSEIGEVWNNVALGPQTHLLTARFMGNTFFIFIQTFLIGTLFFLLIPRIWASASVTSAAEQRSNRPLTGFTNQVRLGDLGELLQDGKEVMRVQVYSFPDNKEIAGLDLTKFLGADPLFRGAVLETYKEGSWQGDASKPIHRIGGHMDRPTYRIVYDLKPLGVETVFTYGNLISAQAENRQFWLHLNDYSQELRRSSNSDVNKRFLYEQFTDNAPVDEWFYELRQEAGKEGEGSDRRALLIGQYSDAEQAKYLKELTEVPRSCLRLEPIATRVAFPAKTPEAIAKRLEDWFVNSGEFNYTTKLSVTNPTIDPIVDFITNRRKGHCEYFASALAMMLRTQGIPSRVITGFKGGTLTSNKKVFRVQQLHAHAWVEAFINGRWVTFDPTPPERNEEVEILEGRRSIWRGIWLGAETTWSKMAGMTQEVQQVRIYNPLIHVGKEMATTARRARTEGFKILQKVRTIITTPAHWFSWEGGIVAGLSILLVTISVWGFRRLWRVVSVWTGLVEEEADALARKRRLVPFYERFLNILKTEGLEQRPTQTAREFVDIAWHQLRPKLVFLGASDWSDEMVEAFYFVRFGGADLDSIDLQKLDKQLNELEESLKKKVEEET